jgi:signal transduction histidine kinase
MAKNGKPLLARIFGVRKDLLRGDSMFALLIFIVVGAFLVNLVASVWHNLHFQNALQLEAGIRQTESTGSLLAKTAEALLLANETSMLRRVVSETALEYEFAACSVVLPNGEIVADADPSRINLLDLPATWTGPGIQYARKMANDTIEIDFPLEVSGRGNARLSMMVPLAEPTGSVAESQTTQMALACLALATVLLVHRHARFRLQAIGAIHEALLAVKDGESDMLSLELDPHLGAEAVAWNHLLDDRQCHQVQAAIDQVQDSIHGMTEMSSELVGLCDALPQGLMLIGNTLHIEYANGAAGILLQTHSEKLKNAAIADHVEHDRVLDMIAKAAANPQSTPMSAEVSSGDEGSVTVLRYAIRPVQAEEVGVMVTIEDITQQKVAERARNDFLAHAAHELRTPLTNVQLYVEKALEDYQDDPADTARSLSVITRESRRLEKTISEILSISEIEAGVHTLKKDDVKLGVVFEQLKTEYAPAAAEKQLELSFDLPPKFPILHADRDKLCLALHNLVGNAIKYTPDGGQVRVKVGVEEKELYVRVSDSGIGISPDDIDKVFDKFYRAKDRRLAHITGSGLGLAIARQLIRGHDGDITVQSEFDQGSTFTLTLPVTERVHGNED